MTDRPAWPLTWRTELRWVLDAAGGFSTLTPGTLSTSSSLSSSCSSRENERSPSVFTGLVLMWPLLWLLLPRWEEEDRGASSSSISHSISSSPPSSSVLTWGQRADLAAANWELLRSLKAARTNLWIFIRDLISSLAAAGDLLHHELPECLMREKKQKLIFS